VTRILLWLRAHVPAEPELPSLIHCDLKLDNVLVDPVTLAAVAVVDWDMTTRGDPLFDLGVLLSYWIDPEDPTALHALDQVPSLEPGFPRRREVAAQYFRATGRPSADLSFHVTLARLRLAIAWQQLYRLFRSGGLTDPKYARLPAIALDILSWTADTLDNPPL
jgi:aminoglycoside phosphotransferase (APT) family kinase protein